MIRTEQYAQALRAIQRLIVHAKAQAYAAGQSHLADLLNDIELLPEYIAEERDRTDDFVEMLDGIVQVHPSCQYIVEDFAKSSPAAT